MSDRGSGQGATKSCLKDTSSRSNAAMGRERSHRGVGMHSGTEHVQPDDVRPNGGPEFCANPVPSPDR